MRKPRHAGSEQAGPNHQTRRRAIVLLLVVTMLGLFAIVALGFVYYAQSESTASRLSRDAAVSTVPEIDPEQAFSFFLSQLLYGSPDDAAGVQSALRGHSMGENMYGNHPLYPKTVPYNGTGRLHYQDAGNTAPGATDEYPLVNYAYTPGQVLRDPGYLAHRANPTGALNPAKYIGGINPSYTYVDVNTMFLAAVNADGEILRQSFHRPATDPTLTLDPNDPNYATWWGPTPTTPVTQQMKTLRPLPALHAVDTSGQPLFPAPADGGGDVQNGVGFKGVPIPGQPGKYYTNDSIWVDLGFPIITATNGVRYKPLFAALVVDLSGKVNVNVHGNIVGITRGLTGQAHVSNQGWGTWEVNLAKVLNSATTPAEWQQIFTGNGTTAGRYGNDNVPTPIGGGGGGGPASQAELPYFFAQVDFDGAGQPTDKWLLPAESALAMVNDHVPFPYFPSTRYGNNTAASNEGMNHPLQYDYFGLVANNMDSGSTTSPQDRYFRAAHLEALYRYGDTDSPALTSDLFRLLPSNFDPTDTNNQPPTPADTPPWLRRMRLLTTHSFDGPAPGLVPWLSTPATPSTYIVQPPANPGDPTKDYPTAPAQTYPDPNSLAALPFPAGEFAPATPGTPPTGAALNSAVAFLGKVNINAGNLTDAVNFYGYPTPDPTTFQILPADLTQFNKAQQKRQDLAKALFERLLWVTTGRQTSNLPDKAADPDGYKAVQYLAQLAVNMVDYRDPDDYMTPFNWHPTDQTEWVFGTELPRVLLNEVYAEYTNDPADPKMDPITNMPAAQKDLMVNFWVELLNPFNPLAGTNLTEGGNARLQVPGGPSPYQIMFYTTPPTAQAQRDALDNPTGTPPLANVALIADDFNPGTGFTPAGGVDTNIVQPLGTNFSGPQGNNQGFAVVGPNNNGGALPAPLFPGPVQPTLLIDAAPANGNNPAKGLNRSLGVRVLPAANLRRYTVLLRRLACPYLPYNPSDPTDPNYQAGQPVNPYITVDYIDQVPVQDAVEVVGGPTPGPNPALPPAQRFAVGCKQPYASDSTQVASQQPAPPKANQPQHTFFRHNSVEPMPPIADVTTNPAQTLTYPFDWLTHLDRQLISAVELLHVSGYRPHELTHKFIVGPADTDKFQHRAPWLDVESRLYRFLETVDTGTRMTNARNDGLRAGLINLNMVWDKEVFQALCDAQPYSNFKDLNSYTGQATAPNPADDVGNIYQQLLAQRLGPDGIAGTNDDRPFLGLGAPNVPAGDPKFPTGVPAGDPRFPQGYGIGATVLRDRSPGQGLFEVPFTQPPAGATTDAWKHPYRKSELLTKIFSNVTVRSNVFAVWLTVGYFEVDDTGKLGPEIGKAENREIRHRMFAVVDRSHMGLFPGKLIAAGVPAAGSQTVTTANENLGTAVYPGMPVEPNWPIQPGMSLVIDRGLPTEETVTVTAVGAAGSNQFTAVFARAHAANATVTPVGTVGPYLFTAANTVVTGANGNPVLCVVGHPGPQPDFEPRANPAVVRYFAVID